MMRALALPATLVGGFVLSCAGFASEGDGFPIAGTDPSERPLGAPVIQSVEKTPDWYSEALTGVSKPYPNSLHFLEDQGNWYTPFNRPGMPGRYDIRGWYQ
jgi:hypothetical protein